MSDAMADRGPFWCWQNPQEAAELIDALTKALQPFANITEFSPLDDGKIVQIEVPRESLYEAQSAILAAVGTPTK